MESSQRKTYYDILGVPRQATPEQIQQKYRELARKYHPDVAEDITRAQKIFAQVATAYQVLRDPKRRADYDQTLSGTRPTPAPAAARPPAPRPAPVPAAPASAARPSPPTNRTAMPRSPLESASMRRLLSQAEGDVLAEAGRHEEALAAYRDAVGRTPNPPLQAKIARLETELAARSRAQDGHTEGLTPGGIDAEMSQDRQPFWRRWFRREEP